MGHGEMEEAQLMARAPQVVLHLLLMRAQPCVFGKGRESHESSVRLMWVFSRADGLDEAGTDAESNQRLLWMPLHQL